MKHAKGEWHEWHTFLNHTEISRSLTVKINFRAFLAFKFSLARFFFSFSPTEFLPYPQKIKRYYKQILLIAWNALNPYFNSNIFILKKFRNYQENTTTFRKLNNCCIYNGMGMYTNICYIFTLYLPMITV